MFHLLPVVNVTAELDTNLRSANRQFSPDMTAGRFGLSVARVRLAAAGNSRPELTFFYCDDGKFVACVHERVSAAITLRFTQLMPKAVVTSARLVADIFARGRWLGSGIQSGIESASSRSNSAASLDFTEAPSLGIVPTLPGANWVRLEPSFGSHLGFKQSFPSTRRYTAGAYAAEYANDYDLYDLPEFDPLGEYLDEVTAGSTSDASNHDSASPPQARGKQTTALESAPRFSEAVSRESCESSQLAKTHKKVIVQEATEKSGCNSERAEIPSSSETHVAAQEHSAVEKREWGQDYVGNGEGLEEHAFYNWMVLQEAGLSESEADEVLRSHQALFAYDATDDIRATARTLFKYDIQLAAVLRRQPGWAKLLSSADLLEKNVGYATRQIRKMKFDYTEDHLLSSCPEILDLPQSELRKRIKFLNSVGMGKLRSVRAWKLVCKHSCSDLETRLEQLKKSAPLLDDWPDMFRRAPSLITTQSQTIVKAMDMLVSLFGEEKATQFVRRCPLLLTARAQLMEDTYLKTVESFGESEADLVCERQPGILTLPWEGMKAKLEYLVGTMGCSLEEVARCPTVLMRSLERIIKKRHEALVESCVEKKKPSNSLSTIMGCTNTKFQRTLEKQKEHLPRLQAAAALFGERGAAEMFRREPRIARMDEEKLRARAGYLMDTMGRTASEIIDYPPVLLRSLPDCIMARHKRLGDRQRQWSLKRMFVCDNRKFNRRVAEADQEAYHTSPPTTCPNKDKNLSQLQQVFGEEGAAKIAQAEPKILSMSKEKLLSRSNYLLNTVGRSPDDVADFPPVLLRDLEMCVIPRFTALGEGHTGWQLQHIFSPSSNAAFRRRFGLEKAVTA